MIELLLVMGILIDLDIPSTFAIHNLLSKVIAYISPCKFILNFVLKNGISLNTCLSEPFLAKSLMLLLFVAFSI